MLLALLLAAAPAPTATAVPEVRQAAPVSAAPRTLADVARERKGREKPSGGFSASDSRGTDLVASEPYTRPKREQPTPAPELTIEDAEPYWRARAAKARADVAAAERKLSDMQASTPTSHFTNPNSAAAVLAAQIRETALAPYRATVREAKARLVALDTECSAAKQQGQLCALAWLR